jgi:hypothetical protein
MPTIFTCYYEMLLDTWRFDELVFVIQMLP